MPVDDFCDVADELISLQCWMKRDVGISVYCVDIHIVDPCLFHTSISGCVRVDVLMRFSYFCTQDSCIKNFKQFCLVSKLLHL